jgi:dTDP-4-dehydrorhamnose reductase
MKILLFGKNGQIGWELQRPLALLGDLIATDQSTSEAYVCGDLRNVQGISQTILHLRPDVIVNAAAYTNVDGAEDQPELADLINHRAPEAMAEAAKKTKALLVHYSSDYVFRGTGQYARGESAAVEPLNAYGKSKLQGEIAVRASGCQHLIFRTSWVYSTRRQNFLKTILHLAATRESFGVVADQFGAPTSADLIADVTAGAIHMMRARKRLGGLYHLSAAGSTSWYEYACFAIEAARLLDAPLQVSGISAIKALSSQDYPSRALRPANSRLDSSKLMQTFGLRMPDWKIGVARTVRELVESHADNPFEAIKKA